VSDEHGATAAFVAIGMLMMLGMVALAVDVGMLVGARTDSQRVADSAALAGAASFITAPNDADRPRTWAIEYAAKNTVHGTPTEVRAEDVDVLMAEKKVRVRVRNIAARSNAIRTVFARVLGWDEVNVGTSAAAEASAAGAGNCMLPLALPDRWTETVNDDLFLGPPEDLYIPYSGNGQQCPAGTGPPGGGPGCDFTGFFHGDINDMWEPLIEIKVQSGPADPEDPDYVASPCTEAASWRCWFQPESVNSGPTGGGANDLRP
jgi:Flp pilus assembly protein TadG